MKMFFLTIVLFINCSVLAQNNPPTIDSQPSLVILNSIPQHLDFNEFNNLLVINKSGGFSNLETEGSFDANVDNIIYVKADATGNDNGSSWTNAYNSLQSAISIAESGDVIWVASGTYTPSAYPTSCVGCNTSSDYTFELKSGVKFYGGFEGTENSLSERNISTNTTMLDGVVGGNKTHHVMLGVFNNNSSATTYVDGFTIKNGEADGNSFNVITVNGSQIPLTFGGGIAIYGGQNTIKNNTFTNNYAYEDGGALFINGGNNLIINNNVINNTATGDGGGIYINYSTNTLKNNIITNNSSSSKGGGVAITYSTNELAKNRISGNGAQFGGGIYFMNSNNTLTNSILFNNSSAYGSAIESNNSTNAWVNNTIVGNTGFYSGTLNFTTGANTLSNNIIWGNNGAYLYSGSGGSLNITNSIIQGGYQGQGNLDTNPLFVNQSSGSNNDLSLQNTSPAINAGNNSSYQNASNNNPANDFDISGMPRLVGSNIDMGALESSVICVPDDSSFNYSSSAFCKEDSNPTPTVTGLTGGTFSSTSGLSLNTSTGEINISASKVGTYTVTYTTNGSCPSSSNVNVTINNIDNALFFYYNPSSYCKNASNPTPLTFGTVNGTFSSTTGLSINPTTGQVNISQSQPGTYMVTHTTSGSCPNTNTTSITIRSLPNVNFTAPSQVYLSDGTQTGLGGGTPQGVGFNYGVYTGPGVTDDGNGTTYSFDPVAAGVGIHTITYTFSDIYFCESTASDTIEVLPVCLPSYEYACYSRVFIDSFTLNTINNSSTGCSQNNYADYSSSISTNLTQGSTYNISCTPGSIVGQNFAVWIDFNQDGDFDEDNEFFDLGYANAGTTITTSISIPTNLVAGSTRLRVMTNLLTSLTQADYCNTSLLYGETEDYSVVIEPGNEWTGAVDMDWSNANNWSDAVVPGATDYAVIKETTNQPIINSSATAEISSLYTEPNTFLKVQGILKVTDEINNRGQITFESNNSSTGQLDEFTGTLLGSGAIEVERYIPTGKRAFRLLSPTVTTSTPIYENWQENGASPIGFGTHITGSGGSINGFDATTTNNPSFFTFDNSLENQSGGASWQVVDNTNVNTLTAGTPYRLFVRGDRNIDLTSNESPANQTVLRATGNLHIGDYSPSISAHDGNFNFVGNPYQAVVDFSAVNRSNLTDFIYVWDTSASGLNDHGGYITVDVNSNTITAPSPSSSDASKFIAPGQAFFVQNTAAGNGSLTFEEADKATGQNQVSIFNTYTNFYINSRLYKTADLQKGEMESDAIGLRFSENYTTLGSTEDAVKLANPNENYTIVNNGFRSIDKQDLPVHGHEVRLALFNYKASEYSLTFAMKNKPEDVTAYLNDSYLDIKTQLFDGSVYNFMVDASIAESKESNRFKLSFKNTTLGNENFTEGDIRLYPNPVKNVLTIDLPASAEVESVKIYTMLGQEVKATKANSVKVSDLSSGVYLVEITTKKNQFTKKIIKK